MRHCLVLLKTKENINRRKYRVRLCVCENEIRAAIDEIVIDIEGAK